MHKKLLIILAAVPLFSLTGAGAYAAWYSYNRQAIAAQSEKCREELANPRQMTAPDGSPALVYSIDTCASIVVPPPLWDIIRGRMTFEGIPERMQVNPYSLADMILGRYTLGPANMPCNQSATTTDCSTFMPAQLGR